ncbi:DUF3168 domain-containing protein [Hoeflea olei]|uniref:DUF3168 domain-containing protein n=1 Tax=Hoeflea olei TaxID=1480615 RepID=A0A1C1YQI4_9HYPH|nr:DUF3168 domain-containing protein [Hoeflea olei]OCW55768.1 hypothetical protein AWJ14_14890 [Hoeflea olei]
MSANLLLKAVVARLAADAELTAITGPGRIFDRPVTRAEPPYLVLGEMTSSDFGTGDGAMSEHRFEIDAWCGQNGRRQAAELAEAVRAALHDADIALEGAVLVTLRHERTLTRRVPKSGFHVARVRFRAVTEP